MQGLSEHWYRRGLVSALLCPLAWIFSAVVALRRQAYARGWRAARTFGVPVLVVGNITVGGAGKTPLVAALATRLTGRGRRVGIVSRGYGGRASGYPLVVDADTPAVEAGDEPVWLARATGVPVAVDPDRPRAAATLIERHGVDFILADDGLQHYALARDAEIAVCDARRGLGNGRLLPAGPLREPAARLARVDLSLVQGEGHDYSFAAEPAIALADGASRRLADFESPVHAVAGIGDPERFFSMLEGHGLETIRHPKPDHHRFMAGELDFGDDRPVLMTDKDAVKYLDFADRRHWRVPIRLSFDADCERRIDRLLDRLCAQPSQPNASSGRHA